ncbi:MAG: UDP-N-acetylmuramoyl-L-alanine--D-glutamate ligase, partial [Frankia sp.]
CTVTPLAVIVRVTARPPYEVLAVELSSFQLHWSESVAPAAAAILNIADDHLDWHGGPAAYAAAKARIWAHPATVAIGNADDPAVAGLLAAAPGRSVTFGARPGPAGEPGLTVENGTLVDRAFGGGRLLDLADLGATGPHNVANALAAAALARAYGIGVGPIAEALAAFRPGAHRNQVVARADGVEFVDDSKATNPHAAAASLSAYRSVVWIAGGLNKGLSFDDLVVTARDHLRAVVLIGRCAPDVAAALARHAPDVPVEPASSMDDAVEAATKLARPGDTVLLAPAAASMDMFRDYAERGDCFAMVIVSKKERAGVLVGESPHVVIAGREAQS